MLVCSLANFGGEGVGPNARASSVARKTRISGARGAWAPESRQHAFLESAGPGFVLPLQCEPGCTVPGKDRKSTRLNSSHTVISYAVFCLKKKNVLSGERVVRPPL